MKHWRQQSLSLPILGVALAALFSLAVLQYQWVGQVSESARERMQTSANAGAARFGEDFDRELARAYLSLQMDALTLRDKDWDTYKRHFDSWTAHAPYPKLVGDIYIGEISRAGVLRLMRFDKSTGHFSHAAWPEDFVSLQRSFAATYASQRIEGDLIVGNSPAPIDGSLPALVIPVARPWLLAAPPTDEVDPIESDLVIGGSIFTRSRRPCRTCASDGPLFAYTVVVLDRAYLQNTFIPTLAQRYLAGSNGLDYNLTIVSRSEPQQIIYQSDQRSPGIPSSTDATANLLSVRLDEFNRLLLDSALEPDDPLSGGDQRSWRISLGGDSTTDATALIGDDEGHWRLILTHRLGSLEAAVTNLRVRNLAISFGVLLLLALGVVMIVISTRRAQRLARQKVEFVAAISHELRTPLTVICAAGENLADGVVLDPQRARQYGDLIHSEGRRLTEMVEQVLQFAGAQSDKALYNRRPLNPGELLERAIQTYQPQIKEHEFELIYTPVADLPVIMGDAVTLQRSIHNLLCNALKYSGTSRWISVRIRAVTNTRQPQVVIEVQNGGQGIDPADLPYIFEPFYRGRDAIDTQIHGSGLGLSMVKLAVEAHGGRVRVHSEPGEGCTFSLWLPATTHSVEQRTVSALP